jgi:hypothetical protein
MKRNILLAIIFNLSLSFCNGQSPISCYDHGFNKWKIGDSLKSITGLRVLTPNDGNNLSLRYHAPQNSIYVIDRPVLERNYCNFGKPEKIFFIENSDTIKYIIVRYPYNQKLIDSILNYAIKEKHLKVMTVSNMNFESDDFTIYFAGYMISFYSIWDENNRPFVDIIINNFKRKSKLENQVSGQ